MHSREKSDDTYKNIYLLIKYTPPHMCPEKCIYRPIEAMHKDIFFVILFVEKKKMIASPAAHH